MKELIRNYLFPVLLIAIIGVSMLFYRLAELPPLWFDEGWTLSVARNWVDTGQYARLLDSQPVTAYGMAKPFSVTGPIALSFYVFGEGVWQGRLPAIVSISLAVFLIFLLARKLYSLRIAYITLFVLLFMAPPTVHFWIIGRQAIAEAPMVFYLVAGYLLLIYALDGKKLAIAGSAIFLGLALDSKGQVLPFLAVSLLVPIILMIIKKEWQLMRRLITALIGSLLVYGLFSGIQYLLYSPYPRYGDRVVGFITYGVYTLVPEVRWNTLKEILLYGIPIIIGLIYALFQSLKQYENPHLSRSIYYTRLSLLLLTCTWLCWFVLLSLGWARYLFPIAYIGSIFIAVWLEKFVDKAGQLIRGQLRKDIPSRIVFYIVLLLVIYSITLNYQGFRITFHEANNNEYIFAAYIKQNIGSDKMIETVESELLFLLDNPFHYPSDQTFTNLLRRAFLNDQINIDYDLSQIKPDYLIDGPMSKLLHFYSPLLENDKYKLVYSRGEYDLYKRLP